MSKKFIPLSVPCINGNELKYAEDAIKTGWLADGQYISKFEDKIKKISGAGYAVALNSGTSGLFLACKVLGITVGDEVIAPTLTFVASINAIKYTSANIVFMDCDDYLNIDADKVERFCSEECKFEDNVLINKKTNRQIKAIMAVHIFGIPCEIFKLKKIADKYNLKIIEDAAESLGASYETGEYTGTIGDCGIFSFNGNKIVTAGGGGCFVTNNKEYADRVRYLATQAKDDAIYFEHNQIGYNFRLSNINAAIGLAQLENLKKYVQIKKENFKYYKAKELQFIEPPENVNSNYWFYCLLSQNRDGMLKKLADKNIQARPIWKLNHLQKPFLKEETYLIENAVKWHEKILNLPCSVNLEKNQIDKICEVILDGEY